MLPDGPEALLLSGTGMPTLCGARTLTQETGIRVLSSAIASAVAILDRLVTRRGPEVLAGVDEPSLRGLLPA